MFLANYTDGLSDVPLPDYINYFLEQRRIASFLCVRPTHSFHVVTANNDLVSEIRHVGRADIWMNGGYFVLRNEIFKYLREGEELVEEPFQRLIQEKQLLAYKYNGFWACMDTFKDKQSLDDMYGRGDAPWEVWKSSQEREAELIHV